MGSRGLLEHFACHSFTGDEFSQGCYTAIWPPRLASDHGSAIRAQVGGLHFAGSETARDCVGYIEGALEAGERAAGEVIPAADNNDQS